MQPGDTITPVGQQPDPTPQPPVQTPEQSIPEPVPQPAPPAYEPEPTFGADPAPAPLPVDSNPLSWTASEFVEHQKPQGWYLSVVIAAIVLSGVMYVLLRDMVTVIVVAIVAILFGIVGAKKPRTMSYTISVNGIQIGEKTFPYAGFKSFSVIEEGAVDSIQLMPLKRFAPPVSLYFPPEQEQEIFDTLAAYLPHEEKTHDPIDRLMKRLHF